MPDVLIEVRGNWIGPRKTQMIEAIHLALVEAIRIPQDDKVMFGQNPKASNEAVLAFTAEH